MDAAVSRMDETGQRISDTEDKLMENMEAGKSREIKEKSTVEQLEKSVTHAEGTTSES